jgi:hypothetical protein
VFGIFGVTMASDVFDISRAPDPATWLALDEGERVEQVVEAHRRTRSATGGSESAHAAIHVAVETRLASGDAAVVSAYERFRAAGVDRHNTVHALASVVTDHMMAVLESREGFDQATADRAFEALDPTAWRPKKR